MYVCIWCATPDRDSDRDCNSFSYARLSTSQVWKKMYQQQQTVAKAQSQENIKLTHTHTHTDTPESMLTVFLFTFSLFIYVVVSFFLFFVYCAPFYYDYFLISSEPVCLWIVAATALLPPANRKPTRSHTMSSCCGFECSPVLPKETWPAHGIFTLDIINYRLPDWQYN